MPRLWSYLIRKFFLSFSFTLSGILIFLVITRFHEIASFSTSGTGLWLVLKFMGLQVSYILPFALPIATLNASLLLSRKLSHEKQYTALRSGGLSLKNIFTPLVLVFLFLTSLNFFITGTIAPLSKLKSKTLIYDTTLQHPLFITQKACPIKLPTLYTDIGKMTSGDSAEDLLLVFKNKKNQRLSLIVADKLSVKNGILKGKNLAIISSLHSNALNQRDDLVIENESHMSTSTQIVDVLLQKDEVVQGVDYLDFIQLLKNLFQKPSYLTELYKRLNLTFAPFSFGILGLAFGLHISRKNSIHSLLIALGLATFFLIAYISAKSIKAQPWACLAIFASSHIAILVSAWIKISTIQKGRA